MSDELTVSKAHSRRAVVKGAAWSVPVIAAAVAAPAAVASVNNAGLAITGTQTGLLSLNLLDGGGTLTATALTTVPTEITVTNGAGAINQSATITVTVGRPAGINIPVGRARGFGVYSYNGVNSTAGQRTAVYQSAPIVGQFGFPITTFTTTQTINVASNGSLLVPIVFGLAGTSTGVAISALSSFPVTITVDLGTRVLSASGSITVPVGAGIL
ncbi:hypothetical protein FQP90_12145 [Paenarthrobacter nitroguajacolicus]|uniref:Uncharacterized protein n=1 Tax=Paenarthrobacter nitroguajacolicus TaxID=211146 RepID=A0A558GZU8_PAENT|nr:hypothetical protein [Paenarthrobacter nitroguajacolicus]TVU62385.1 hypothetical protein FQP90_12145 [Paenarthrobacter nitroguajacolicus]